VDEAEENEGTDEDADGPAELLGEELMANE
jgi:hypothetical protein